MAQTNSRPFRALLGAFLRIDLRAQHYADATGSKPQDLVPPLYWVFGQFLAISCLLTALLFGRVSAWFFAAAHLVVTVLLIASALVVEIDEAIFDPKDQEVLAHRPIPARTYAAARLTNLLAYVALMTVALGVFPSIVGTALRDSNHLFAPAYLFAEIVVTASTAALIVLLRTLSSPRLDALRPLMAWIQIVAIVALFYGGQLVLRNGDGQLELFAANPPEWFVQFPTSRLARSVVGFVQAESVRVSATAIGISVGVAASLVGAAVFRLSATYRALGMSRATRSAAIGTTMDAPLGRVAGLFTRSRIEAASFLFTARMFLRDPDLRLRLFPALSLPVAALVLGVATDQCGDPFVVKHSAVILPLTLPAVTAGAMPQVLYALRFTRHADASWLFDTLPASRNAVRRGTEAAVTALVVMPFATVVFAVLAYVWNSPLHALAHAVFMTILCATTLRFTAASALDMPFSRSPSRGTMSGMIVVLSSVVTGATSLATGILYAASGHELRQLSVLAGLSVLLVGMRAFVRRGAT
jgi:hypothetical protein